ncbi:hypothetical protein OG799_23385 [Micromonospora sp. NBC_00898]|uniref:hypothetical protein n=1 Tax=Micromonospora sp. NBC_00898 TaxID=2975981 RepID=UPI003863550F|nr:hypothetical protein OG799_23385 [Micromonospora sp. NBC_00898]
MTTDLEEQLAAGMRDEVAGLALTRDVLGDATRRHRRRTTLHRTAYAVGVVGVVGALAATLTVGAGAPGGTTGSRGPVAERPAVASADTPQMRLAAAAAASENISYRVKVTTTSKDKLAKPGELPEPVSERWVTKGAFDPATATGYLDSPYEGQLRPAIVAGFEHERLIDGVRYVGASNASVGSRGEIVWSREEGKRDKLDYDMAMGGGLGASASPEGLLRMLRQAGATVTEKADGVYHFEVTVKDLPEILADTFVGEVTVGADNRIAKVAYTREARANVHGRHFTYHLEVVIELSDYGMPVKVEVPPVVSTIPAR